MVVAPLLREGFLRVVLALAAADWLLAFGMTAGGVHRQVSVPLLAVAAAVLVGSQRRRLAHLICAARSASDRGVSKWSAVEMVLAGHWSPRVARLVLREPRLLWSIVLLLRGRRDGAPDRTFSSHSDALPVWVVLGGVALVEVALTPLLPVPAVAHAALLVVGVWSLLVLVGLIAALVVHPHVVTTGAVRLRFGFWDEIVVPRAAVSVVRTTSSRTAPRGLRVADGQATLSPTGVTNMELDLAEPVVARGELVTRILFWADAPQALAAACKV